MYVRKITIKSNYHKWKLVNSFFQTNIKMLVITAIFWFLRTNKHTKLDDTID